MVEDKIIWQGVNHRITNKISNEDYKLMCRLHAKYFNHKYNEPCTCNKKILRKWILDLNEKLLT